MFVYKINIFLKDHQDIFCVFKKKDFLKEKEEILYKYCCDYFLDLKKM